MMGALPQSLTTMPPVFAGLVPAAPAMTGDEGGFEQLVAVQAKAAVPAAPVAAAVRMAEPVVAAPASIDGGNVTLSVIPASVAAKQAPTADLPVAALPAATPSVAGKPAPALPVAATPQPETDGEPAVEPKPATKAEAATADTAITVASWLLGTAGRFTAPVATQPAKAPVATKPGEGEATSEDASAATAEAPALTLSVALPVPTAPTTDRPVKDAAPKVAAPRDDAPALPLAASKARDTAPLPAIAIAAAEPQAAKPVAEPSMTILFAQPAAQTGAIAEAAKPVIVAERILDLTSDDAWIEQLASDIAATKSASNDVSFRLMPRHLGRLDVSMLMGDDGVSLKLDTQHEATATIVSAAQVRLVDDLRQQGVRVTETQVTHTPTDAGRQSQQGQGRSPAQDAAHRIETATERDTRPEPRDPERAGDRRSRFA